MRIKETPVYSFNELSDSAKQKAIEGWLLDFDFSFHAECVMDDAEEILKLLGFSDLKIYYSGFCSQGDGACFVGNWYALDVKLGKVQEYAPVDSELHGLAKRMEALVVDCPEASATLKHFGHYHHENSVSCDCDDFDRTGEYDSEDEEIIRDSVLALEVEFDEIRRELSQWIYSQLQKEYEFQTSEEAAIEGILANDYEFNEDGSPA